MHHVQYAHGCRSPMKNIGKLFASPTILEVLEVMYADTTRKFFVRELADICNRYPSGVLNSLRTLERAGVVHIERMTRETYYKLNAQFPAYLELGALIKAISDNRRPRNRGWQLRVNSGPDLGQHFDLTESVLIIGRHNGCHVQLTDPKVSRRHARIRTTSHHQELHIDDLGSKASTYINQKKRNSGRLIHGDILNVGNTELELMRTK